MVTFEEKKLKVSRIGATCACTEEVMLIVSDASLEEARAEARKYVIEQMMEQFDDFDDHEILEGRSATCFVAFNFGEELDYFDAVVNTDNIADDYDLTPVADALFEMCKNFSEGAHNNTPNAVTGVEFLGYKGNTNALKENAKSEKIQFRVTPEIKAKAENLAKDNQMTLQDYMNFLIQREESASKKKAN